MHGTQIRRQFTYPHRADFHQFPLTEATRRRRGWETERDCSGNLGIGPTFPAVTNTELEKRSPWPLGLSLSSGVFRRGKFGRGVAPVQGPELASQWLRCASHPRTLTRAH